MTATITTAQRLIVGIPPEKTIASGFSLDLTFSTPVTLLRICWAIDGITLLVGLYVFVKGILTEAPEYDFYLLGFA